MFERPAATVRLYACYMAGLVTFSSGVIYARPSRVRAHCCGWARVSQPNASGLWRGAPKFLRAIKPLHPLRPGLANTFFQFDAELLCTGSHSSPASFPFLQTRNSCLPIFPEEYTRIVTFAEDNAILIH